MAEFLPEVSHLLAQVRLVPVNDGRFELELDGEPIFNLATERDVPDPRELLERVRSRL